MFAATAACGSSSAQAGPAETSAAETEAVTKAEEESKGEASPAAETDVLVAYFSATGTTKGVAEKIAAVTGGDLYEILAAEPYSGADLNYNDSSSRSTKEQNDKNVRPAIGSEDISLAGYTTLYLGFPIWWGEEPRILDTFVEKYSFDGITVIPFCTSGGSGIGRSGPNMEALAGSGIWKEGKRFGGSVSESELQSWIDSLK
ncbi:MAG: flavodoxin [Clostridium sp.]|nr:flavodoxin [Clostridium sp.]